MDHAEKKEFIDMQSEIKEIHQKVNEVYDALVGNAVSKDGGLIGRIHSIENAQLEVNNKIKVIEEANVRSSVYIGIIGALGGALLAGIVGYIFNHIN